MSARQRQGAAGASFPPIEVGSFVSHRPDKSEFIGSASGVFFANTVFRAFAASSANETELPGATVDNTTPTPSSLHGLLTATADASQEQGTDDDAVLEWINSSHNGKIPDNASTPSYGTVIPGLGAPPPPATAKRLLMIYFQKWHPLFPFLHGPTFFDKVNRFYGQKPSKTGNITSGESMRDRLCLAVCFQCVFNIAALNDDSEELLELRCRITAPSVLTSLLGILAGGQDIGALQVLLAAELYLITRMSSRAASTVHGALTRVLYQAGLHRCPFRYIQLPRDMLVIRQRIWWCTYVLDRYLSLSLGHPMALSDDEVDVCVPGTPELHNPVGHYYQSSLAPAGDQLRAHLPINHESFRRDDSVPVSIATTNAEYADSQGSTHQDKARPVESSGSALGSLVTYSQLLGAVLRLFHKSIHRRSIELDDVLDITARIHSWWNSLPSLLQDEDTTGSNSPHGTFFAILYHQLILFVNRPFLSLPTDREDFRSSLQSGLNASRSIVRQLKRTPRNSLVLAWPGSLSATWMAGLVVAYASLLKIYPLDKGISDINNCLDLLGSMSSTWASAGHCRDTLNLMLGRLESRSFASPNNVSPLSFRVFDKPTANADLHTDVFASSPEDKRNKRRRQNSNGTTHSPPRPSAESGSSLPPDLSYLEMWQPVLEYTGPDFGFDAYQFCRQDAWQQLLAQGLNPGVSGLLFDNAEWDSYVKTFGDRLS